MNKRLQGALQQLMTEKATSLLLRSAVNYSEVRAVASFIPMNTNNTKWLHCIAVVTAVP